MKRFLLPESGTFYKANLHCHTNLSDGHLTPEEVKRIYKEQGYSIVAYTDHDLFIPHPELADLDFLPLHGMEMEINEEPPQGWDHARSCHLCFIALKEDTVLQPCWHRSKYRFGNAPGNAHLFGGLRAGHQRYTVVKRLVCAVHPTVRKKYIGLPQHSHLIHMGKYADVVGQRP